MVAIYSVNVFLKQTCIYNRCTAVTGYLKRTTIITVNFVRIREIIKKLTHYFLVEKKSYFMLYFPVKNKMLICGMKTRNITTVIKYIFVLKKSRIVSSAGS